MHPILLKIGPFELYTYGAFLAVAFLVAIWLATRETERAGLKPELAADMGIVVILSSIVGSRVFYILFYDLQYTLEDFRRRRRAGLLQAQAHADPARDGHRGAEHSHRPGHRTNRLLHERLLLREADVGPLGGQVSAARVSAPSDADIRIACDVCNISRPYPVPETQDPRRTGGMALRGDVRVGQVCH
jgi:hypothetical protein